MPRISVVIPTYNHEKYVGECIQSVLDQTYQDFEIIITDDGSSDGTVHAIKNFKDPRIQLYEHVENKGACTAVNNCIRKAVGDYIAVLSSDDAWKPTKLEKQVKYLDIHPEVGAVFTKADFVDEAGNVLGPEDYKLFYVFEKENRSRYEWLKYFFSSGNCLCHPSVLIRKECYEEVGLYDERMANIPDQDMWTRLCFKYEIHILDEKLVRFRVLADKSSASADKPSTHIRSSFEYLLILNHYLTIKDSATFLKIFPEAEKYGVVVAECIPYFLSRLALDVNRGTWNLWGLQTLLDFLGQAGTARTLEKKYGFRRRDFYNLTAQHDIFNILGIVERDACIASLESQLHSLEFQVQQIQRSIPMQLLNRYRRVIERLLRSGTRRRYYYELMLTGIIVILNEGWRSFFRKLRIWLRLRRATARKRFLAPKFKGSISKKEARKLAFLLPSEKPGISIVIPVYNKWNYTLNCLKSICENTDGDYEVVVINDASTDETVEVLSNVKNLNLVTSEQNMGFVESCNRGARASKSKYILFLNNDTMVTKGWLPPLLEVIKREDVGAVGSKLVYPDGTLQEAGGIIWNDGTAWNYGRGDKLDKPEYNYVREVDYCSGACLLVKRELFERIGGFDERFKPAYCEESDLCLSLKSLGYKVVYQPLSVVVHFERVTTGDSIKKYQEPNIRKLEEKWRDVLQENHYPLDIGNLFLARDRRRGQCILVIDYSVPTYDKDAGSLTIYGYLRLFSEMGFRVTFIPDNGLELMPYTQELQQMGIEVLYGHFDFNRWLKECGKYIDMAWLTRPEISVKYVDKIRGTSPALILYYTQDLHYLREQRRYEVERDEGALKQSIRLKELEFNIFGKADVVLTPSIVEKEIVSREFPSKRVEVIPAYILSENLADKVFPFNSRKDLLFLAGFNHTPSVDAAIFLVNEIFPLIKQKLPGVCLYIVGNNPPKQLLALKSSDVIVTGYVKDLAPYFESCRLFLAPIRYGAGVKGKIVVSMGYGLPVVTTSIGAEGIDLTDGENALISDDPQEFAEKAVSLYNDEDLWNRVSTKSIETVSRDFSYELARYKIKGLVSTLNQSQAKRRAYREHEVHSPNKRLRTI